MFNSRYNKELYEEYKHWLPYITDIYLPIIDSENGDFRQLPFEGTIWDQPYMTFQILKVIQLNYRKFLSEKVEKLSIKGKNRPTGSH